MKPGVIAGGVAFLGAASLAILCFVCYETFRLSNEVDSLHNSYESDTKDLETRLSTLDAKLDRVSQHKCQAKFLTPAKFQGHRGTCWDFTTLSILEQTYRRQGVENGWLDATEYVVFSEHAYGVAVIEFCRDNPSHCPHVHLADNSTDGGYISWIYYFTPLQDRIMPNSVCPYVEDASKDHECDQFHVALETNPLKFRVRNMVTLYDVDLIKEYLRDHQNAMAWVSVLGTVTYYVPCIGSFENTTACNVTKCTKCPLDLQYPTKCCVKESRAGWNLEGEFYTHREMEEVGAHAMTLVAYNDNHVSHAGDKGGFIVKNSWGAWHSHTVQYWMDEMSGVNEKEICPNSRNPRTWEVGHTILQCVDTNYCDHGVLYHLVSIVPAADDTVELCFTRTSSRVGEESNAMSDKECSPPMPLDLYADFFSPIAEQIEPNDEDACGYFFVPYRVVDEIIKRFGFFWATDFDIAWDSQSFAANRADHPSLDYHHLLASTSKIYMPTYPDALPFFPPEDGDDHANTKFLLSAASTSTADNRRSKQARNSRALIVEGADA